MLIVSGLKILTYVQVPGMVENGGDGVLGVPGSYGGLTMTGGLSPPEGGFDGVEGVDGVAGSCGGFPQFEGGDGEDGVGL